ncbi:hypothetical protein J4731_15510 [Providencia rettgeri]|nr:hypothetical protein [Providencia rettgeri]
MPPSPIGGFGGAAAGAMGQQAINPPDINQDSRRFAFQSENDYAQPKGHRKDWVRRLGLTVLAYWLV